ncbi:K+ transport protein [Nostoc sp. CENA543]|uniref:flavin-containing monooxygenase n=1 Tax=Nostoc sp. CENA543 TaxID=1869241 RepID=UPI000CA3D507|nr:NAD(P)/FAD-dependent oxidoreductase [Nostoc sp. CENA543]AUT02699.1 K+ transport protein [Nostoc sp. CENA543]
MQTKKVCVIGAGVSGLVTARNFIETGYEVTVFETQAGIGGVWEKSRVYPGLTIQSPRDTYAFPDYPMPASYPEWPTAEQTRNYLISYAEHFGVTPRIRFQTEVTQVTRKTSEIPKWLVNIRFRDQVSGELQQEQLEFDFVVVCTGIFHIPYQPSLPGKEEFIAAGGQVLHTTEFNNTSIVEGKRVVVVGLGKSATDIATLSADVSAKCTMVFRQIPWKIPKFFLGKVNIKYVLLTRFAESWLPYRKLEGMEWLLHSIGKPLVWAFWRINEILLRYQLKLDACGMIPDQPLTKWVVSSIALETPNFYQYVASGKIQAKKTEIKRFVADGVELATGEHIPADIVVFGTGFRQDVPFLAAEDRQTLIDKQGNFQLYRNIIHPHIPNLGFVGYNSSKFCPLTSDINSQWLLEYFQGNLNLPTPQKMLEEIALEWQWKKQEWEYGLHHGTSIFPFSFHYIDELMSDMGIVDTSPIWQKILKNISPMSPANYQRIRQTLKLRRPSYVDSFTIKPRETVGVSQ